MVLLYFFLYLFISLCNAGCGTFIGKSGNTYYLDALTKKPDYTGKLPSVSSIFYYNYCQNVNSSMVSCTTSAPSVQVSATGTCTPIGLLPAVISEVSEGQLTIVYTNNQNLCGNPMTIPRVTTLSLSCSPNTEYNFVKMEEPGVCQYNFYVETKYACAGTQPVNKSDCCIPQNNPGCLDEDIQTCVCKSDPSCCNNSWDSQCVAQIESLGCGDCKLGKCCEAHIDTGCEERATSTCVCDLMEECCTKEWSRECVMAVNKYNCGQCPGICCAAGQPCMDASVRDCVCKRDVYCCRVQWDATCVEEAKQHNCTYCANPTPSVFSTMKLHKF